MFGKSELVERYNCMKKLIMSALIFVCVLGLTACGQNGEGTYSPNSSEMQENLQSKNKEVYKSKEA